MANYEAGRTLQGLRRALEVIAPLMVIIASMTVIGVTLSMWKASSITSTRAVQDPVQSQPPAEPQSLEGVPVLGDSTAKVAIIEYADFECPFCVAFSQDVRPKITRDYVDTKRVLTAFRHLPLSSHEHSRRAAVSAECAGRQGRFWEMHQMLFQHAGKLDTMAPVSLAQRLALDLPAFDRCMNADGGDVLERDERTAYANGLIGTPTFLIGRVLPDRTVKVSHVLVGAQPFAQFKVILDELLEQTERKSWFGVFR